jgi:hypothetical protein
MEKKGKIECKFVHKYRFRREIYDRKVTKKYDLRTQQ